MNIWFACYLMACFILVGWLILMYRAETMRATILAAACGFAMSMIVAVAMPLLIMAARSGMLLD